MSEFRSFCAQLKLPSAFREMTIPAATELHQAKTGIVIGANAKAIMADILKTCVGRRNLARIAHFLTNAARLDVANDMRVNGELLVQKTILKCFPSDRDLVVFDVGANVGEWSMQLLRMGGRSNSFLHAFEPVSSTMQMLKQNLYGLNTGWKFLPIQRALSDRDGISQMFVIEEGCGINAITPDPKLAIKRTETIQLTTVDDYCKVNNIPEIGLLKIDAEGHDLFVIRGARQLLSQNRIDVIQFEYNFRWIWSRTTLFEVFEYVNQMGYRVGKVTPKGIEFYDFWDPELEKFVEGNYLICRPDWVERFPHIRWWKTN
jgi:FkbM family methyltransferase